MYCPCCSQEQVSTQTKYCSRCGFLMTGVANLIHNGGVLPANSYPQPNIQTTRRKGLKQGLFMFLLTFLLVPLIALITMELNTPPTLVAITAIFFFIGGILRMLYALLFESNITNEKTLEEKLFSAAQNVLGSKQASHALPPKQTIPFEGFVPPNQGNWRDTNDLVMRSNVTERSTLYTHR